MLFGWANILFRFLNGWALDGVNDFTQAPNQAWLNFGASNQWSISVWMKAAHQNKNFLSKSNNSGPRWFLNYGGTGSNYFAEIFLVGTAGGVGAIRSTQLIASNVWTHIVFTLAGANATNWRAYINGVVGQSIVFNTLPNANADNIQPLRIGAHPAVGQYLNGALDEIQIYNKVISADEVTYLYNAGNGNAPHPSMAANLVARYNCDTAAGVLPNPIMQDVSAFANDAIGQNISVSPLVPH